MRQAGLLIRALRRNVFISLEEAREGNRAAGSGEVHVVAIGRRLHGDLHGRALGISHLGCHGALPNQLVELVLLGVELACQLARSSKTLTCRADGLVGLLRVLHLAVIGTRTIRHELGAENGRCRLTGST